MHSADFQRFGVGCPDVNSVIRTRSGRWGGVGRASADLEFEVRRRGSPTGQGSTVSYAPWRSSKLVSNDPIQIT